MDRYDFIQTWVALEAGAALGQERLRAFYAEAGKRGINVAARQFGMEAYAETPLQEIMERGRARAQPPRSLGRRVAGKLVRRSPYIIGGAAGLEMIRRAPDLYEDIVERWDVTGAGLSGSPKIIAPRKPSKFNKAIKTGMAIVKKSKSFGKPGSIRDSKKAFTTVTQTVSGLKKGRKAPKTGIRSKIARAVRKYI